MKNPRMIILAGPNGAGKSTLSKYLLPSGVDVEEFVNADQIAAGLSAFTPESVAFQAGRIMLSRINELDSQRKSFAFETTLSSRSFATLIKRVHKLGYIVELIYIALPSAEYARRRVKARVREGGHKIAAEIVTRRFYRSLWNLHHLYLPIVDRSWVYDNSTSIKPLLIASANTNSIKIYQEQIGKRLLKLASL